MELATYGGAPAIQSHPKLRGGSNDVDVARHEPTITAVACPAIAMTGGTKSAPLLYQRNSVDQGHDTLYSDDSVIQLDSTKVERRVHFQNNPYFSSDRTNIGNDLTPSCGPQAVRLERGETLVGDVSVTLRPVPLFNTLSSAHQNSTMFSGLRNLRSLLSRNNTANKVV